MIRTFTFSEPRPRQGNANARPFGPDPSRRAYRGRAQDHADASAIRTRSPRQRIRHYRALTRYWRAELLADTGLDLHHQRPSPTQLTQAGRHLRAADLKSQAEDDLNSEIMPDLDQMYPEFLDYSDGLENPDYFFGTEPDDPPDYRKRYGYDWPSDGYGTWGYEDAYPWYEEPP